ncbi:hypothetical protein SporoP37_00370 [Sporosarcina sp. P37]|uniref:hypothetical protein n=1 Tax=unclassified Sporosarcina TaxID=2647733 RepID=UPI000A17F0BE|nr:MULTISPECIES: hypothetical protein [unclassified Sporosarcina]ARK23294.1 hypothetical protein SporoP37_00370 [Sporosarcina sp. P37]PID19546.1 hypothetical protein CSV62_03320 [Sporosarcina sp. P35]
MKVKTYISEVIVGALILIIISLCFSLVSVEKNLFPSWLFPTLVGGFFTLIGAFLGAKIAGDHAVKVMAMQIELQKKERIAEKNFEFRKRYAEVDIRLKTIIRRLEHILQGKFQIGHNNIDGLITLVDSSSDDLKKIPIDLISEDKYTPYISCITALNGLTISLEWLKEHGVEIQSEEFNHYKEVLINDYQKLKE